MHLVKDISAFADQEKWYINVIVDVPKGSNNKYEYDHKLWCFKLDRVIHSSMYYPVDYGFIPQTLSLDWDPCDVCLLVTNPTFPWCLIKARPIGILFAAISRLISLRRKTIAFCPIAGCRQSFGFSARTT